jgi:hypothetical protein
MVLISFFIVLSNTQGLQLFLLMSALLAVMCRTYSYFLIYSFVHCYWLQSDQFVFQGDHSIEVATPSLFPICPVVSKVRLAMMKSNIFANIRHEACTNSFLMIDYSFCCKGSNEIIRL